MKNLLFRKNVTKVALGIFFTILLMVVFILLFPWPYATSTIPGFEDPWEEFMGILIWPLYFLSLIVVMTSQRLPKAFLLLFLGFIEVMWQVFIKIIISSHNPSWFPHVYFIIFYYGLEQFFPIFFFVSICLYGLLHWPGKKLLLLSLVIREMLLLIEWIVWHLSHYFDLEVLFVNLHWFARILWLLSLFWLFIFYSLKCIRSIQSTKPNNS